MVKGKSPAGRRVSRQGNSWITMKKMNHRDHRGHREKDELVEITRKKMNHRGHGGHREKKLI